MVHGGQGIPRDILEKVECQLCWVLSKMKYIVFLFLHEFVMRVISAILHILDHNGQQALGTFKIEFATQFHFTPIPSTMENIL